MRNSQLQLRPLVSAIRSRDLRQVNDSYSIFLLTKGYRKKKTKNKNGSEIIQLDAAFVDYLRSGSTILLPASCQQELDAQLAKNKKKDDDDDDDDDDESWTDEEENTASAQSALNFDTLDEQIRGAMKRLGGKAFVKLNWSAPRDAYWALGNRRSCESLSDVYILLKSSDFISHDVTPGETFHNCDDFHTDVEAGRQPVEANYVLVLREWISLNTSMEFRCFVRDDSLIGISQRDCRCFYPTLVDNQADIIKRIETFYAANIRGKFASRSYVFDVVFVNKVSG